MGFLNTVKHFLGFESEDDYYDDDYYDEEETEDEENARAKEVEETEENEWENISIKEHVDKYIAEGMTSKDAIKKAAADRNLPKRDVYNEYHRGE